MEINLNGEKVQSQSRTLMDLIVKYNFDPKSLIAEINFQVIKQETWTQILLKDGDNIELLSFVGGG